MWDQQCHACTSSGFHSSSHAATTYRRSGRSESAHSTVTDMHDKRMRGQYDRACQEQIEQRARANSILNLLSLLWWSEINSASPVGQKDT
jgi:hypothetical protein